MEILPDYQESRMEGKKKSFCLEGESGKVYRGQV